jgi:hypothetical protein
LCNTTALKLACGSSVESEDDMEIPGLPLGHRHHRRHKENPLFCNVRNIFVPFLNRDIILSLASRFHCSSIFIAVLLVLWKVSSRHVAPDVAVDHREEIGWD